MNTAILILNWNAADDTIRCIESLFQNIASNDYLFIIDNGSTDNSLEEIKDYFTSLSKTIVPTASINLPSAFKIAERFYLVKNNQNLGFGAGNNAVLKQLATIDSNFNYAWLLNNDTIVKADTLQSLKLAFLKNKDIAVAGSLIMNYPEDGTIQCSGVRHYKFFGVSKLINKNKPYLLLDRNKIIKFDYLNGASLLLNVKALYKTGYFDELFFLYSEEYDLQLRLMQNGYKLVLDLNSIVYHKLANGTRNKKHLFYFYYNTSAILLSKKHFSIFYTLCAIFNLAAITFIRTFPSFKNFKWGLKGIAKAITNIEDYNKNIGL